MDIDELHVIRRILLDGRQDPIAPCLERAFQFLSNTSSQELLEGIVHDLDRRERMRDIVTRLDHVGFVAFTPEKHDLDSAAKQAGFDGACRMFPSRIVARELGRLLGTAVVPTQIFKARGTSLAGAPIAVEIFLPESTDSRSIREWTERGCAVHVALTISEFKDFPQVIGVMADEGFQPPAFADGMPLMNDEESMTALYFDGRLGGQPLRIEYCHFR